MPMNESEIHLLLISKIYCFFLKLVPFRGGGGTANVSHPNIGHLIR
jgi:hypothetical protein